jgi:hypothetical protein
MRAAYQRWQAGKPALPPKLTVDQFDDLPGGLAGDEAWLRLGLAQRRRAIRWVRWHLLDATYSDKVCEMVVMSLSGPKREDLLRRAAEGRNAEGF